MEIGHLLDGLPAHIALIDKIGTITDVNLGWRKFAYENGAAPDCVGIGKNYFDLCEPPRHHDPTSSGDQTGPIVASGLRAVVNGSRDSFSMEYPCHGPNEKRWFRINITKIPKQQHERFIIAHENISDLVKARNKTRETYLSAIQCMISALEQRDPYTAGHQSRVSILAVAIGRELDLDEDTLEGLLIGSIIHDIGKITVPTELLTYPGKLSSSRFAVIQEHPTSGKNILETLDFPWPVREMVHQHHERYDGSGYPCGLSGDDILIESKILCVADVFEAISAHRPYRKGLGIDIALDEIRNNRGIKYDPIVTDALFSMLDKRPEVIANLEQTNPEKVILKEFRTFADL